jgi:hypothetical protein
MFFPIYIMHLKNVFNHTKYKLLNQKSFSKLNRVKNKYRSTLHQDKLTALMILATENDILLTINR